MKNAEHQRFFRKLSPIVGKVFAQHKLSPALAKRCLEEAAAYTNFGRFVLGNNYWGLRGKGNAGFYTINRVYRTSSTSRNGGYRPHTQAFAKFSSIEDGVKGWIRARVR